MSTAELLSTGQCAALACLLEVAAPKPGNVHRGADFEDVTFTDFAVSALAIAPALDQAADRALGQTVLAAVQATRGLVQTNTNLGTILLLAPLAILPPPVSRDGIRHVLGRLDAQDAQLVYQAIRLAEPGGMDRAPEFDVFSDAPPNLLDAMRHAQDRDLVARQYANEFAEVFEVTLPWLLEANEDRSLNDRIIHTQVRLMSRFPDSLIARKCGQQVANQSAARAAAVLQSGNPGDKAYFSALADLDFWLRCDGHRRNPGTTADMIAAALFVALRQGNLRPPFATSQHCERTV